MNEKQRKAISRCRRYYHYWCSGRLAEGRPLSFLEKLLHFSARFRLRHMILGFPIEFKLYSICRSGSRR